MTPDETIGAASTLQPWWRFSLRQIFCAMVGIGLICTAFSLPVKYYDQRYTWPNTWPTSAHLLLVAGTAAIAGALIGSFWRALLGAMNGMLLAYALCAIILFGRLLPGWGPEILINGFSFAMLGSAALAGGRNGTAIHLIAIGYVPATLILLLVALFIYSAFGGPVPGLAVGFLMLGTLVLSPLGFASYILSMLLFLAVERILSLGRRVR